MFRWFQRSRIRQLEKAIPIVEARLALAREHGDLPHVRKMDDRIHYYRRRIARLKFNLSQ